MPYRFTIGIGNGFLRRYGAPEFCALQLLFFAQFDDLGLDLPDMQHAVDRLLPHLMEFAISNDLVDEFVQFPAAKLAQLSLFVRKKTIRAYGSSLWLAVNRERLRAW